MPDHSLQGSHPAPWQALNVFLGPVADGETQELVSNGGCKPHHSSPAEVEVAGCWEMCVRLPSWEMPGRKWRHRGPGSERGAPATGGLPCLSCWNKTWAISYHVATCRQTVLFPRSAFALTSCVALNKLFTIFECQFLCLWSKGWNIYLPRWR